MRTRWFLKGLLCRKLWQCICSPGKASMPAMSGCTGGGTLTGLLDAKLLSEWSPDAATCLHSRRLTRFGS